MKYVFSASGGSGSSFLVKALEQRYIIDSKPDTYIVPKGEPFTPKKKGQHQLVEDLSEIASKDMARAFYDRTEFRFDFKRSINDNLIDYLGSIRSNPIKTAVFNALPKFEFFSRNKIPDIVFVIRNPLTSYASLVKEGRHANLVKHYGGADTSQAVEYYARTWDIQVKEYLALREYGAKLVRYEYMKDDVEQIEDFFDLMKGWKKSAGSADSLKSKTRKYMQELVGDSFFKIYRSWDES